MTCKQRIDVFYVDVFKILNNLAAKIFEIQFQVMDHKKNTKENQSLLKLLKSRTEAGRNRFATQGAFIFNDLAKDTRDELEKIVKVQTKLRAVNV